MKPPRALTIAGSDSGGGAGIQADIKTFSALGCYGMSVLTALTAQNTRQVTAIHDLPPEFIRAQIDAVFTDIGVDAVKVGMLNRSDVIREVASALSQYRPEHIVVDPVMVAKSGDRLLQDEAVATLKEELLPLATLLTPNLPECEVLTGRPATSRNEMEQAGRKILNLGPKAVLVKGGHLATGDISPDCLVYRDEINSNEQVSWFEFPRIDTKNKHGTGCTLSSAIAAQLAKGELLDEAISNALAYLNGALRKAVDWKLGKGHGPVHHFYRSWPEK